jgi:DNA-binding transcriptional LysR family regulator
MLPDLNRLKVFYFVYSQKGVAAAAKKLNITQSAVSQQLQKLEGEIKTPLFIRLPRRLIPTQAADKLFTILRPFLQELESSLKTIENGGKTPMGLLRIGTPAEFGKQYFPAICAAFRKKYDAVTFSLYSGGPAILLPLLDKGKLDFAFLDMFPIEDQAEDLSGIYSIEPIIEEKIILVCSKNYYDAHISGDHALKKLLSLDYIAYEDYRLVLKNWFKHHFGKSKVKPRIVMTVDSIQAALNSIRGHVGLGMIASHLAWEDIQQKKIIPITTSKKDIVNPISLAQLQNKIPTFTEKAFISFFRQQIQSAAGVRTLQTN